MSLKVIELNDLALRVWDETGELLHSPGFALADGQELLLGEPAEQQARLQPTRSYNKYWQQLNLDPIDHGDSFRHHADIAFAHLQHLATAAQMESEVIIAVPGSFSRQQLAILLGLAQHCPFTIVGLVDSALAAALGHASAGNVLYADLQLHQVVISKLTVENPQPAPSDKSPQAPPPNQLRSVSTVQVPGVGSLDFTNGVMQLATRMFIQQCRFNPQHDAESEQQLYNELPGWLAQAQQDGNLILELQAGDSVHTARLPMESLVNSLSSHYQTINDQLAAMATGHDTQLLVSRALADKPGFMASLPASLAVAVVADNAIANTSLEYRELISDASTTGNGTDGQGISLVSSLPLPAGGVSATRPVSLESAPPTHVLHGSLALPVKGLAIKNHYPVNEPANEPVNGNRPTRNIITLSIEGLPANLGSLKVQNDGVVFDSGELDYLLNGVAAQGERRLESGDRIQFTDSSDVLTLIRVAG